MPVHPGSGHKQPAATGGQPSPEARRAALGPMPEDKIPSINALISGAGKDMSKGPAPTQVVPVSNPD